MTGDGSGTVRATLFLDDAVAAELPRFTDEVRLADLRDAGWETEVRPPDPDRDAAAPPRTALVVAMAKRFPSTEQLADVLAEIDPRLFPAATLDFERRVERTTYRASVTVDRTLSLRDFSDAEVAELIGEPLGRPESELVALAGRPLDETVSVTVTVSLPDGTELRHPSDDEPVLTLGASELDVFEVDSLVIDQAVVDELDRAERFRSARPLIWAAGIVFWMLLVLGAAWIWSRRRSLRSP